jgi:hypothetical protein
MDSNYFQLGNIEKSRLINLIKVLFGAACLGVAIYWIIFRMNSTESPGTIWITIIFLAGFGFYEVWSGFGKADRYIVIDKDSIKLKKYIFLSGKEIKGSETSKIESFPLKVIFHMKNGNNKIMLRFGTTYYEINEKIKDSLEEFAGRNNIPFEIIKEDI